MRGVDVSESRQQHYQLAAMIQMVMMSLIIHDEVVKSYFQDM